MFAHNLADRDQINAKSVAEEEEEAARIFNDLAMLASESPNPVGIHSFHAYFDSTGSGRCIPLSRNAFNYLSRALAPLAPAVAGMAAADPRAVHTSIDNGNFCSVGAVAFLLLVAVHLGWIILVGDRAGNAIRCHFAVVEAASLMFLFILWLFVAALSIEIHISILE